LDLLMKFREISKITKTKETIIDALKSSKTIKYNGKTNSINRTIPILNYGLAKKKRDLKTFYVSIDLTKSLNQNNSFHNSVVLLFKSAFNLKVVSVRKLFNRRDMNLIPNGFYVEFSILSARLILQDKILRSKILSHRLITRFAEKLLFKDKNLVISSQHGVNRRRKIMMRIRREEQENKSKNNIKPIKKKEIKKRKPNVTKPENNTCSNNSMKKEHEKKKLTAIKTKENNTDKSSLRISNSNSNSQKNSSSADNYRGQYRGYRRNYRERYGGHRRIYTRRYESVRKYTSRPRFTKDEKNNAKKKYVPPFLRK